MMRFTLLELAHEREEALKKTMKPYKTPWERYASESVEKFMNAVNERLPDNIQWIEGSKINASSHTL